MFGPPCHNCGSDEDWLPGKDGEACRCGWPKTKKPQIDATSFGDTHLGENLGCGIMLLSGGVGLAAVIAALKYAMT